MLLDQDHKTSYIVTNPYGLAQTTGKESNTCVAKLVQIVYNYYDDYQHTWSFTLDKHLKLNITFKYISIFIFTFYLCNNGNVTVASFSMYLNVSELTYCGTHAYTPSFPLFQLVDIILSVRIFLSYYVSFT